MMGKKQIKIVVDILMTVALLFLMAFQVTGDEYHEWIGAGMLVLFLIHNGLNFSWYKALFKGNYTAPRIARTVINIAVLVGILLTAYSGIVMSRYVFEFLPISGGMATARQMHMAGSYWTFILMGVHLGMHWSMVANKLAKKIPEQSSAGMWILRIAALAVALYGGILFGRFNTYSYMFLQNHFVMFDYDKMAVLVILENLIMMSTWVYIGYYFLKGIMKLTTGKKDEEKRIQGYFCTLILTVVVLFSTVVSSVGNETEQSWSTADTDVTSETEVDQASEVQQEEPEISTVEDAVESGQETVEAEDGVGAVTIPSDEFILVKGGTFEMGSPESENWRSADETQHTVTVSDFYMSQYELTQDEYEAVMGENPSSFSGGSLPVESISWLDAINYCNTRSQQEGLAPAYKVDGDTVVWNRGADGYRLPTEAEWEYACRAGTTTPFNTETSISPEESNYYGHYPYDIEENYFEQENLTTKPGEYRQTTVAVDSFAPNSLGFYNMHGNVSEWVWDYYGSYDTEATTDPTGPATGNLRVYRGGGWNDFAKNMRSAYRATLEQDLGSFNIGIRLVRNAVSGPEELVGGENASKGTTAEQGGNILIAYYSWSGNTRGIAEEIQEQTGADIFEITLVEPYSTNYSTVLDESQHDQNIQARPEIADQVDNMEQYDTIILGYPNWWASIPMPIATFLESYDFSGKTIIPFCSHGGGRFGQSLTAIAKLAPNSVMGEGLSVHYSGGTSLSGDIEQWLASNGIER